MKKKIVLTLLIALMGFGSIGSSYAQDWNHHRMHRDYHHRDYHRGYHRDYHHDYHHDHDHDRRY